MQPFTQTSLGISQGVAVHPSVTCRVPLEGWILLCPLPRPPACSVPAVFKHFFFFTGYLPNVRLEFHPHGSTASIPTQPLCLRQSVCSSSPQCPTWIGGHPPPTPLTDHASFSGPVLLPRPRFRAVLCEARPRPIYLSHGRRCPSNTRLVLFSTMTHLCTHIFSF